MRTTPATDLTPLLGTLILRGHPVTLKVESGHLVAEDGLAGRRRRAVLSRICPDVRRVLVFTRSGYTSFEALEWLHDVGIPLVHLHPNGTPIFATARIDVDDARIRRAQAVAETSPHGLDIARWLIGEKIRGQAGILRTHVQRKDLAGVLDEAAAALATVDSLARVRLVESAAAAVYWGAWEGLRPRFPLASARKIPAHWRAMKGRRSPLTNQPRRAAEPVNAMLNYLYAVSAAEVQVSLRAHGCDVGLGILHLDRIGRASLVYDALEPIRPLVDAFLWKLLQEHTFDRRDFLELKKGDCRVLSPLANHLAAATSQWQSAIDSTCLTLSRKLEHAGALAQAVRPRQQETRMDMRGWRDPPRVLAYLGRRMNGASGGKTGWFKDLPPIPKRCRRCGEFTPTTERLYCDACKPLTGADGSAKAAERIQRQKTAGTWTGLTTTARRPIGQRNADRFADIRKWRATHPVRPDPKRYAETLFPRMHHLKAAELRAATGLGKSYCQRVLRGMFVPHAMHWDTIAQLIHAHEKPRAT